MYPILLTVSNSTHTHSSYYHPTPPCSSSLPNPTHTQQSLPPYSSLLLTTPPLCELRCAPLLSPTELNYLRNASGSQNRHHSSVPCVTYGRTIPFLSFITMQPTMKFHFFPKLVFLPHTWPSRADLVRVWQRSGPVSLTVWVGMEGRSIMPWGNLTPFRVLGGHQ